MVHLVVDGNSGGGGSSALRAFLTHRESSGVAGGTSAAVWTSRKVNYLTGETSFISLDAGNIEFTLDAGTYDIWASLPIFSSIKNSHRLYNVTDSALEVQGTSGYDGGGNASTRGLVIGRFTIAAEKIFKLETNVQNALATQGHGVASGRGGEEVYSLVEIVKVS
jgi:hypothetical protein